MIILLRGEFLMSEKVREGRVAAMMPMWFPLLLVAGASVSALFFPENLEMLGGGFLCIFVAGVLLHAVHVSAYRSRDIRFHSPP